MVTPASVLLDDVGVAYRQGFAVEGVTGRFEAGSFTALVGPNGGGKSSLVKAIVGAVPLASGRITVEGVERRDIAYLPQRADIDVGFPMRASHSSLEVCDLADLASLADLLDAAIAAIGPDFPLTRDGGGP